MKLASLSRRMTAPLIVLLVLTWLPGLLAAADPQQPRNNKKLVVHEWGTFTVLQDEMGRQIGGINVDDEPVPQFVHNLDPLMLTPAVITSNHWIYRQKRVPRSHPYVTVRLETPVIYFYPPENAALPMKIDVDVTLKEGWLSEFYPYAKPYIPGLGDNFEFESITSATTSSLSWKNLSVGVDKPGPETDSHVWLAPRKVQAVSVENERKEVEKYLFYRGVGNFKAPVRVATDHKTNTLTLFGNGSKLLSGGKTLPLPHLWLVHVKPDGAIAWRTLAAATLGGDDHKALATFSSQFKDDEYAPANLTALHQAMHNALVSEGLYADEATAMLSTWQRAYFTSPGLRVFYTVPRQWTDERMPLKLSVDAEIDRVMIGRIELITAQQRELLAAIAKGPASDPKWTNKIKDSPAAMKFWAGRSDFGDLGVEFPEDYKKYLALGRFRNALLIAEEINRPTPELRRFITNYGLSPFRPKGAPKGNDDAVTQTKTNP